MHPTIENYLSNLGMADPMKKKIKSLHDDAQQFLGESIEDCIVGQTLNQDGTPQYLGAYFFTATSIAEYPNCMAPFSRFYIVRLKDVVSGEFSIDFATIKADGKLVKRVMMNLRWIEQFTVTIVATDDTNYNKFVQVYKQYIQPHLAPST